MDPLSINPPQLCWDGTWLRHLWSNKVNEVLYSPPAFELCEFNTQEGFAPHLPTQGESHPGLSAVILNTSYCLLTSSPGGTSHDQVLSRIWKWPRRNRQGLCVGSQGSHNPLRWYPWEGSTEGIPWIPSPCPHPPRGSTLVSVIIMNSNCSAFPAELGEPF